MHLTQDRAHKWSSSQLLQQKNLWTIQIRTEAVLVKDEKYALWMDKKSLHLISDKVKAKYRRSEGFTSNKKAVQVLPNKLNE